jgi:hypothetical protein
VIGIQFTGTVDTEPKPTFGGDLFVYVRLDGFRFKVIAPDMTFHGFTPGDRLEVEGTLSRNSVGALVVQATVARTPA